MANTIPSVNVRKQKLKNGDFSLFLDFYPAIRDPKTNKSTRREFLGLRIYHKPKNQIEMDYNQDILAKAEAIRCIRVQSLVNMQFGFMDRHWKSEDFIRYFKEQCEGKNEKWLYVLKHFEKYTEGKCSFGEITVDFCNGFKKHLQDSNLSGNSSSGYWGIFRTLLKNAYKNKKLPEDINGYLDNIPVKTVRKEFLTMDEVKRLRDTPCKQEVLKRASLFSILTGLRISDIMNLKWENIIQAPDGGYCMQICTIKSRTEAILPISDEAYGLCGKPGQGTVFKGMKRAWINKPLKCWLKEAGITKPFTFHCFRHTFATLQIAAGTDIYTVSKMLTHANVSTTQIYADIVNSKKRESANKLSLED